MSPRTTLDDARARIARRQQEVVADLLAGRIPEGFDAVGADLTGEILIGKRLASALHAGPHLELLPQWRSWFRQYAQQVPAARCAHDDVVGFVRWLDERHHVDDDVRDWLIVERIYAAGRRIGWVRYRGRRELVIGLGARTWHLALTKKVALQKVSEPQQIEAEKVMRKGQS